MGGGILIISLFCEYTGIHIKIAQLFPYPIQTLVGRTIECMPFACTGIILKSLDSKLEKVSKMFILMIFLGSYFIYSFNHIAGFAYSGIGLVVGAAALFILCVNLLFKRIPKYFEIIINKTAEFTMGIFYIHILIGKILHILLSNFQFHYSITFPVIVWSVSLGIAALISINKRWRMMVK